MLQRVMKRTLNLLGDYRYPCLQLSCEIAGKDLDLGKKDNSQLEAFLGHFGGWEIVL